MGIEQITLFHTNDIHSCFDSWSNIVGHVKAYRNPSTLFLELGDHADRCHPMTEATDGKGNVALLNEAGIDYATIGNNEGITFSKEQLEHLYDDAQFPVLVGNLYEPNGERPHWVEAYKIHVFPSGLRVGIIGWTAPFTQMYEQLGWKIDSRLEPLYTLVKQVKQEADIVILLSHLGLFRDEEIAEQADEIDVIIGAHTHHVLEQGKRMYGTLITQVGKLGQFLGEITLTFDHDNQVIVESNVQVHHAQSLVRDQGTDRLFAELVVESQNRLAVPVARLEKTLPVHWQETTEVVQLLCDALAEWCQQDLAMLNAGVLLESFEKGLITKGDIHRICPHPINPCVVTLSGGQLQQAIVRAFTRELRTLELKGFGFRGKLLGKMIFTGIELTLDEEEQVRTVDILGKPLEENKQYTIATLDMYTFGYLFPSIHEAESKHYFMPEFLRDILAWKLGQK